MGYTKIKATKTDLVTLYARVFGIDEKNEPDMHTLAELVEIALEKGPFRAELYQRDDFSEYFFEYMEEAGLTIKDASPKIEKEMNGGDSAEISEESGDLYRLAKKAKGEKSVPHKYEQSSLAVEEGQLVVVKKKKT